MADAIQAYVFAVFFAFLILGGVAAADEDVTWPEVIAGAALWPFLLLVLLAIGVVRGWRRITSGGLT